MAGLELRIPPPVYVVVIALLMWLVSRVSPGLAMPWAWRAGIALVLLVAALGISASAIVALGRARTTIHPLHPSHTSAIVTTGVYRFSRNPMYLAMLVGLIAIGILLGNAFAVALACCFVPLVDAVQIRPEERILASQFGDPYRDYCRRVRRWI